MTANLPALQVVLPLIAAPVCLLLRGVRGVWLVFLAAAIASLACSILLAVRVHGAGPWPYAMGGWQRRPVPGAPGDTFTPGIELVIDGANVPILLLVSVIAVVAATYARQSVETEIEESRRHLFYSTLCLCLTGLLGIVVTADAFNVFVFLEISSLSTYALVAMGRHRRALLAAFQYLVIGTIGSTFLLLGIGLLYAKTGALNMADLASLVQRIPDGDLAITGALILIFLGLGIKMAVFPLHAWLPGAYAEAPSAVSVFIAATGTKVAIYAFLRFAFTIFGADLAFSSLPVGQVALLVACAAMLAGSAVACFQSDFKRLLAWSSVGQIGYIVAGFALATPAGLSASYLYLINHAVIKAGLFCVAGIVFLRLGSTSLAAMSGLGHRMPVLFGAMVIGGLGLVGMPLTGGFVGKWALLGALIEQGQWPVVGVVVLSSLVAVVYVGRLVEVAWFRRPPAGEASSATDVAAAGEVPGAGEVRPAGEDKAPQADSPAVVATAKPKAKAKPYVYRPIETRAKTPLSMAAATAVLTALTLYLGIDAVWPAAMTEEAARTLLGGGG